MRFDTEGIFIYISVITAILMYNKDQGRLMEMD